MAGLRQAAVVGDAPPEIRRVRLALDLEVMPWMGIDFGSKRIGVAVSHAGEIAEPHSVIARGAELGAAIERIARLVAQFEVDTIVVGIPKGGRVAPSGNLRHYERFAELLGEQLGLTVILWDESYSTTEAASLLRETGGRRRDARERIDMLAAAVILQSYLDSRRNAP